MRPSRVRRTIIWCAILLVPCLGAIALARYWAIDPRIGQLKDPSAVVREHAAFVLSLRANLWGISDPAVIDPLIAALNDPDAKVRAEAAAALGNLLTPRGVEPLISALKDRDNRVRLRAAYWLGRIKDPRAVDPLIEAALSDREYNVKRIAADALGIINDPGTVERLIAAFTKRGWEWSTGPAASVLFTIDRSRAIEILIASLKDPDAQVRANGARGLSRIYNDRAVAPLISALDDPDVGVRRLAAAALGKGRDARAVAPLLAALNRPDLRADASRALVTLDKPEGVGALLALFGSNPGVVVDIHEALVMLGQPDSEERLIDALNKFGNAIVAETFLNSGNAKLSAAATKWAYEHGFQISPKISGSATRSWGSKF